MTTREQSRIRGAVRGCRKGPIAGRYVESAVHTDYPQGEKTTFAFIRPTVMLGLFGSHELEPVAEEVERTVREIVEMAAR